MCTEPVPPSCPAHRVEAQVSGGGQERGIRSGTVATPLVVGLGKACEVAQREMATDSAHVERLERRLRQGIQGALQGVVLNGPDDPKHRWGRGGVQGRCMPS
jgi:cysteine desulfurase